MGSVLHSTRTGSDYTVRFGPFSTRNVRRRLKAKPLWQARSAPWISLTSVHLIASDKGQRDTAHLAVAPSYQAFDAALSHSTHREMIGQTGTHSRGSPLGCSCLPIHVSGHAQSRGSRRAIRSFLLAPRSIAIGDTSRPATRELSRLHPKQPRTPRWKTSIASYNNDGNPADEPSIESDERAMPPVGDPVGVVAWGGKLPSTRRMVVGGLAGVSIGETLMAASSIPHLLMRAVHALHAYLL